MNKIVKFPLKLNDFEGTGVYLRGKTIIIMPHGVSQGDVLFSMLSVFLWAIPMCHSISFGWILNID